MALCCACGVLLGVAAPGCESDARVAEPKKSETPQVAETKRDLPPATRPAERPTKSAPDQPRPATQPADAEPSSAEPNVPEYVIVERRFDARRAFRLLSRTEGERRLIIESENVQRIKLDRSRIPLRKDRSIVLQLDGQTIEWMVDSPVTEFERTVNGEWVALPPANKR